MAIFKQVEVRVVVNENPLPEYEVPQEEVDYEDYSSRPRVPQLHKYIECVPGANFEIDFKPLDGFEFKKANYLDAKICIDGKEVDRPLFDKNQHQNPFYRANSQGPKGCTGGIWKVQRYRFTKLLFGVEEHAHQHIERSELVSIGTIKVSLQRVICAKETQSNGSIVYLGDVQQTEKNLKGCGKDTRATYAGLLLSRVSQEANTHISPYICDMTKVNKV